MEKARKAAQELQDICHTLARRSGWWTNLETGEETHGWPPKRNVGEMLCLVHSEISEAMEGHRKGLQDDKLPHRPMLEVELADAVIRIMDIAGGLNLDLPGAIEEKLVYNMHRADHQPQNRRDVGGKKF
jgi:NTP pyrophosphatase (non-canonical NTP hydrolase)